MFKAGIIKEIKEEIERHPYFHSDDFQIVNESFRSRNSVGATLLVKYRFQDKYQFRAVFSGKTERVKEEDNYLGRKETIEKKVIAISISPGELMSTENRNVYGYSGLESAFSNWLDNLRDELRSIPIIMQIEQQQEEINNLLENVENLSDDFFTREEADALVEKMDKLEEMIRQSIRDALKDEKIIEKRLREIERDFEVLREQISTLTKRGWAGSFTIRYNEWKKNIGDFNLLQAGIQSVKGLLVDNTSSEQG